MPQDIYKLDYIRRNVQFIDKRACCGCYDEVIGMSPSYKKMNFSMPTNDFICRSEYNLQISINNRRVGYSDSNEILWFNGHLL